jgi:hypothetical protein
MTQNAELELTSVASKSTKLSSSSEAEKIKEMGAVMIVKKSIASGGYLLCRKGVLREIAFAARAFLARLLYCFRAVYKVIASTIASGHRPYNGIVLRPKAPLGHSSAVACLFVCCGPELTKCRPKCPHHPREVDDLATGYAKGQRDHFIVWQRC